MFAASAASATADTIFNKFKDMLKIVIDKYGTGKVRYAVLPFGSRAITAISFSKDPPSQEDLKRLVDGIVLQDGDADVKNALEKAKDLFGSAPKRTSAKNVLIVLTDKKSVNGLELLKQAAKPLEKDAIKVVPVALGNKANTKEMEIITTNKGYLVESPLEDTPDELAEKIMGNVIRGTSLSTFCNLFFLS